MKRAPSSAEQARADALVAEARGHDRLTDAQLRAGWARLTAPRAPARLTAPLLVAATALSGFVVFTLLSRPAAPPWQLESGAALVTHEGRHRLDVGRLQAGPAHGPARLETPQGQVAWQTARFLLEVTSGHTVLAVEEGEVVWSDERGAQRVTAGTRLEVPPRKLELPEALRSVGAARSTGCPPEPQARRSCLRERSAGDGLEAQNALFEQALLELELHRPADAVSTLRLYGERFPTGVFAVESQVTLVVALAGQGRNAEARALALRLEQDLAGDPLIPAVRELRRRLERSAE